MAKTTFSGPVLSENGFQNGASSVITFTTDRTLTAADNGKTFILGSADNGDVTLPAVTLTGFRVKFIVGFAITTSTAIISAEATNIEGALMVASTVVDAASETNINFIESADNIGDWATVVSDGTNWYVDGRALNGGGITVTT